MKTILVTGGAGFIGANFVLQAAADDLHVVNLDKLTYAGNLDTLASLQGDARHVFAHGDIGDRTLVARLLNEHKPDAIVNFAAESHVDRSIDGPAGFVQTNVVGTLGLLECARDYWRSLEGAAARPFASCTCLPTRCTARSAPRASSPRLRRTHRIHRTPRRRPPPTTWCVRSTTPTACRCSPPTARTITGRTNSRKS